MPEDEKSRLIWIIIAAVLGSTGISTGVQKFIPGARGDAFTATDGRELERRIDKMETRVGIIEYRLLRKHDEIEHLRKGFEKYHRGSP